jgi:hypothetical protein
VPEIRGGAAPVAPLAAPARQADGSGVAEHKPPTINNFNRFLPAPLDEACELLPWLLLKDVGTGISDKMDE